MNYKFDQNELIKIKVDLSFIQNDINKLNSTKLIIEWVNNKLKLHPEIKPIVHVLKRFLQIHGLNSSFDGGLSSFSLLILVYAYLKLQHSTIIKTNLGRILIEFFDCFGKYFNFKNTSIDVNSIK